MRTAHHSFGFRVGGYGYRNTQHADKGEWDDCRMDGVGIFGQRTFGEHFFGEVGFDMYSSADTQEQLDAGRVVMDRVSGIATVAAGAKVNVGRLTPYVQSGLGLEATRIRLEGSEDSGVYPMGFVGLGADLRLTRGLSFGMNFRTNVMKHFVHGGDAGMVPAVGGHDHTDDLASEYELAAQGQFFLRYQM